MNAKKISVLEMGKSAMKPSWTYKLGQYIITIEKKEIFGYGIHDDLSPEKHIDRIFGNIHNAKKIYGSLFTS